MDGHSSDIPIVLSHSTYNPDSPPRNTNRRQRSVTINTSDPRADRRDKSHPPAPKSPWPTRNNNVDYTDDEQSPVVDPRRPDRYQTTPRAARQWSSSDMDTQSPRTARSVPSLRSPPAQQYTGSSRPSYSPPASRKGSRSSNDTAMRSSNDQGSSSSRPPKPPSRAGSSFETSNNNQSRTDSGLTIKSRKNSGYAYQPRRPLAPTNGAQTQYMNMLLSLDKIPQLDNILVSCFTWILLAGFVVIPGSFTSLKKLEAKTQGEIIPGSPAANALLSSVANTSVTAVGFVCMGIGTTGAIWLGWRWRKNYVWLLNKLYMPLMLNGLAGVISTITNVYSQQKGEWRTQAIVSITVEGSVLGCAALLFALYNFWLLDKVKDDHESLTLSSSNSDLGSSNGGNENRRSFIQKVGDYRKRPPIAPGSVV
ncbi:hypothetical protein B0H66DRAFT_125124 [Apodospora peruviana]|uniref:Uncharacterized protein n=1 Tax=Apodospora peruviana TaxID=516989 RepID=A0AAE0IIC2_9PEZI|nr:hypothetical protein B0H66DRAFT_125124 [Apodospora peruviana]